MQSSRIQSEPSSSAPLGSVEGEFDLRTSAATSTEGSEPDSTRSEFESRSMTQTLCNPTREADLRSLLQELANEAQRFRFEVAPNPCVGAAVLAGGRVIGRGFHEYWGGPHAEREALRAAEQSGVPKVEWDTLVVTLEPCSTEGKTPACTDSIIASGVRQVVVSELDPDSRHRGAGLAILESAGIGVTVLAGCPKLSETSTHFLKWTSHERVRRPRPWVIAKWAQTRSGQLTPPEDFGDGRWISSPESLAEVQVLRSRVDAIVTGYGTVHADDPRMTVRAPGDPMRAPARVVLDTNLRMSLDARILKQVVTTEEAGGPTWVLARAGEDPVRHRALVQAGAQVTGLKGNSSGQVSLRASLNWLWEAGARRVLLECGTTLLESFLRGHFVDQVRIYTGDVNGGRGPSMGAWLTPDNFDARLDRSSGADSVLEAFVRSAG